MLGLKPGAERRVGSSPTGVTDMDIILHIEYKNLKGFLCQRAKIVKKLFQIAF